MNMTSQTQFKKLILVVGATGAQGIPVVDALISPSADGGESPYAIRALTRDPNSRRSQELVGKGVELVKGKALSANLNIAGSKAD